MVFKSLSFIIFVIDSKDIVIVIVMINVIDVNEVFSFY